MRERIVNLAIRTRILWDINGQDYAEYALIAAFVTTIAVAISPDIATNVNVVLSKVNSTLHRSMRGARSSD